MIALSEGNTITDYSIENDLMGKDKKDYASSNWKLLQSIYYLMELIE